jgi:hypothetical protein
MGLVKETRMKPFMDKEERDKILKERDELVEQINNLDIAATERRFLVRRISIISEKLLNKAMYGKDVPSL